MRDDGYIAVGSANNSAQYPGALIIKLSSAGAVQWQREVGPAGATWALFNAVQPTSDGGYVALGEFARPSAGVPRTGVLAVKFDSAGNLAWQRGFNDLGGRHASAAEHALTMVQTSDGGYLIGGNWSTSRQPGQCCTGALLLKLDSSGAIQWQKAYSGGVVCFDGTCVDIGAVVYSLQRTADGGYQLAGDASNVITNSQGVVIAVDGIVPWMAKVDAAGNLRWQHNYYQVYAPTRKCTQRVLSIFDTDQRRRLSRTRVDRELQ